MEKQGKIRAYIHTNLKAGKSKEHICDDLAKRHEKKGFLHELLNYPNPELFHRYYKWNKLLMILLFVIVVLKLYLTMTTMNISGIFFVAIYVIFISMLMRGRGWVYPTVMVFTGVMLYSAAGGLVLAWVVQFPPEIAIHTWVRPLIISMASANFMAVLGSAVLSGWLWKRIHPGYKLRYVVGMQ